MGGVHEGSGGVHQAEHVGEVPQAVVARHVDEGPRIGVEHGSGSAVHEVARAHRGDVVQPTSDAPSCDVHGGRSGVVEFDPLGVADRAAFIAGNGQDFVEAHVSGQAGQVRNVVGLGFEGRRIRRQVPRGVDDLLKAKSGFCSGPLEALCDGFVGPEQVELLHRVVEHRGAVHGDDGPRAGGQHRCRASVREVGAEAVHANGVEGGINDGPIRQINARRARIVDLNPLAARPRRVVGAGPRVRHHFGDVEGARDDV